VFALYLKTKNFHCHVSGPLFRDYHLLLDEQSDQIFATTNELAERVRKIGTTFAISRANRKIADHQGQRRGLCAGAGYAARIDERQ
jgi:starvation-inducible DNA-binding protein